MSLMLVCNDENDLYSVLRDSDVAFRHCTTAQEAFAKADPDTGILILADGYPESTTVVDPSLFEMAAMRGLHVYIEFPGSLPDLDVSAARETRWERAVVSSDAFGPDLAKWRIMMIHGCRFVDIRSDTPHIVVARVAGFDTAVYGLPDPAAPILFEHPRGDLLVATTKLSQFVTGRYAPADAWGAVWRWILNWACPGEEIPQLRWTPTVRPSFRADETLPADAEERAFGRGVQWFRKARLFIHDSWQNEAGRRLDAFPDGTGPGPEKNWPAGDGRCGMIEGAGSRIHPNGRQDWRYHVRNDCMGESSMAMAFASALLDDERAKKTAANLNDFIYFNSLFAQGPRANPESASYGLISWTSKPPGDGMYYGDDNARSMLGTMAVSALLPTDRWDEPLLKCLLANLRTTGPLGFRNGSLNEADLQTKGWRYFWETERTHYAPHYESWLWACFLWAYRHTRFSPFLDRASTAIRMTMEAYPDEWRWTNGIQQERARMLLPLAWLVRVDDSALHRKWLRFMAEELLRRQDASGAIREEVGSPGHGAYGPPKTNEEYGTTEAPLIQQNGDPLSDLLYTNNFAFAGLHEAAAATGDPFYAQAATGLARFFSRIQARSETHPELDGGWFRAFDSKRWDYWASNADLGWGAWSIESGWTQAWITSVLALRRMNTSFWELTSKSRIAKDLDTLVAVMLPDVKGRTPEQETHHG